MPKNNVRLLVCLWIWTATFLFWAQWAHWAPYWGHPTRPSVFDRLEYSNLTYTPESAEWKLQRIDIEGVKEKLRSGRPIDTFILSALNLSVMDLNRLTPSTIPDMIQRLLDQKELIRYTPVGLVGPEGLAQESRLRAQLPTPDLAKSDLHRINADLLSSWYPLEFEKFAPNPLHVVNAPTQPLGYMDLKLRFKAQREESKGILFQTANRNQGIRLQLTQVLSGTTELKVVVGWQGAKAGSYISPANELVLSTDLDHDQEHTVVLQLNSWGDLSAFMDGVYIGKMDSQRPMMDNVVIGNGSSGYQPFWGTIEVDHLEFSKINRATLPNIFRLGMSCWLALALAIANAGAFFGLFKFLFFSAV